MFNSSLNLNRFLLPSLIFISLVNLGISIYLVSSKSTSHRIKYVDATAIWKPIEKEVYKTVEEMLTSRNKEMQVLREQIQNLQNAQKVNGYLTTKQKKNLKNKEIKLTELSKAYQQERGMQFVSMAVSKLSKVNENLEKIAKKNKCTIMLINVPQTISGTLQAVIAKHQDLTDDVLKKLGMENQETKKDSTNSEA